MVKVYLVIAYFDENYKKVKEICERIDFDGNGLAYIKKQNNKKEISVGDIVSISQSVVKTDE